VKLTIYDLTITLGGDHFDAGSSALCSLDRRSLKMVGSMDKIAAIIAKEHAQLWINHDQPQSDAQKKLPAYYE
jgi:hypothetical protein